MDVYCAILAIYKSDRGSAAILDFSEEVSPRIGMKLKHDSSNLIWKIKSTSPPIILSILEERPFKKVYSSDVIWDCILEPVGHTGTLKTGDLLVVYQ